MNSWSARTLVACSLLLAACPGARSPTLKTGGPVSADAPSWARAGDEQSDEGALFVCEGAGPDEAQALESARALCSAKICALCGVEVKSTLVTTETLDKVEVERKVVETCRRVRKSDEEVRYRQAGCGPGGCNAWLQVFFSKESEARECRAYADGDYADSTQCEALIDRFRGTRDLTAAAFRARAQILDRAIVACAEIDVRPTPKLTALDEILWQGVISPRAEPYEKRRIDGSQPIAERLRLQAENSSAAWKADFHERAYKAIDRQPLLESKVFVERIAVIRDAMLGYESIMAALEALVDAEQAPGEASDAALVRALRRLRPVTGRFTPRQVLGWVAGEISRERAALRQPAIKAYFMEIYASAAEEVGYALLRAMTSDERASDDEWKFVTTAMRGCFACGTTLLDLRDHGGEPKRLARLVELAREADTEAEVKALQGLDPEFLLRAEQALDARLAAQILSYEWLRRWLVQLPTLGPAASYTVREGWLGDSHAASWTVTPAQHEALSQRAFRRFQEVAPTMRCDGLDKELSLLELHGVDTRGLEPRLCQCVSDPRHDGMRDVTELYQRLVAWNAGCVGRVGT